MKTNLLTLLFAILLVACHKDDDNDHVTLPAATQTGAGTFACYVNGKALIDTSGGYFNCYYQFVDGGYYFGIHGSDTVDTLISIYIGTNDMQIFEGQTYQLFENIDGNAWAGSSFNPTNTSQEFSVTNQEYSGELTITKLNFDSQIISGTFNFNILNPYTGETVEIRDGRFDRLFTQ